MRAQAQGQLEPGRDIRALARFFLATRGAIALMHRATGNLEAVRDIAKVALSVFDAPTANGT
ncbi:hypothetical protein [Gloeobacter morelensis]|uniref:TetR family transcriptional regulator n=1 Tax=Gloeobacter morelensis MG652769 TaxID=2781736 RepID=A0ABY3PHE3_9CYAN|nr:hypothetical protein [Gloeobacter morelensis]UFP93038.1 hypothetical protein ISF26_14610 [Gloeobacter morelensis MG652769]